MRCWRGSFRRCGSCRNSNCARLVDRRETKEVVAPSGVWYQIELQAFWDEPSQPGGVLRVMGAIDDGSRPAVNFPLTEDFLIDRDGTFVDE